MGALAASMTPEFRAQMKRLLGLKFAPADLTTHWEALQDMPSALLEAAVDAAQRECQEFPSPTMLRAYGDQVRARTMPVGPEPDRSVPTTPRSFTLPDGTQIQVDREWKYYCEACSDTGWRSWACGTDAATRQPWLSPMHCGREADHGAHEWTEPCPCSERDAGGEIRNRAVRRKRERDVQMAAQRGKAKGDAN